MIGWPQILRHTLGKATFQLAFGLALLATLGLGWQAWRPGVHPCAVLTGSLALVCDPEALPKVTATVVDGIGQAREAMTEEGLARQVETLKGLATTVTYSAAPPPARPRLTVEMQRRTPVRASTDRADATTLAWLDQGATASAVVVDALWLQVEHDGRPAFLPRSFVRVVTVEGYDRCRTSWDSRAGAAVFECAAADGAWTAVSLD